MVACVAPPPNKYDIMYLSANICKWHQYGLGSNPKVPFYQQNMCLMLPKVLLAISQKRITFERDSQIQMVPSSSLITTELNKATQPQCIVGLHSQASSVSALTRGDRTALMHFFPFCFTVVWICKPIFFFNGLQYLHELGTHS